MAQPTSGLLESAPGGIPLVRDFGLNTAKTVNLNGFTIATSGAITQSGNINMSDGANIVFGTTTGSKIGTATTQLLAFYNSTPTVQPATTGNVTAAASAGSTTTVFSSTTFTGGVGTTAYTVPDIIRNLKNLGLLAS